MKNQKLLRVILFAALFLTSFLYQAETVRAEQAKEEDWTMNKSPSQDQIESFVDNYVNLHMDAAHTPGFVITVVFEGQVILSKGYGYANLETSLPFTPQTTLRAGSVSKPVTSSAVLALVDAGLLRLDSPVSDYLPGLLPVDDFGQAATIAQLLTLQGGYSDVVINTHSPLEAEAPTLKEYLQANLPARSIRPGTLYSYSSFDHGLLGLALEETAGEPFSQVVRRTVFEPLGMLHSTFSQPLPEEIAATLAQGYAYTGGEYRPVPLDHVNLTPGIALVTSGEDMGRFMLMLLNGGTLEGKTVLSPASTAGMLERRNEVHPYSRARTYGLSEVNLNNRAALYHDGNGIGFSNRLVFLPDQDFGMFLSTNHRALGSDLGITEATNFIRQLSADLLEEFFPPSSRVLPGETPLPDAAERTQLFTGHYRLAGTPQTDFFKIQALLDNVTVRDNRDGTIQIGSTNYVETQPGVFRTLSEPYFYVVFTFSPQGTVEYLTFGGTGSYAKVKPIESFNVQAGLMGAILLIALVTTLTWPFTRYSPAALWLASALSLAFLIGLGLMLTRGDLLQFFKGVTPVMQALMILPWLSAGLTILSAYLVYKNPAVLPHAALPLISNILFIIIARYWQLFL